MCNAVDKTPKDYLCCSGKYSFKRSTMSSSSNRGDSASVVSTSANEGPVATCVTICGMYVYVILSMHTDLPPYPLLLHPTACNTRQNLCCQCCLCLCAACCGSIGGCASCSAAPSSNVAVRVCWYERIRSVFFSFV